MTAMERKRKFRRPARPGVRAQTADCCVRRGVSGIAGEALALRRRKHTVGAIATGWERHRRKDGPVARGRLPRDLLERGKKCGIGIETTALGNEFHIEVGCRNQQGFSVLNAKLVNIKVETFVQVFIDHLGNRRLQVADFLRQHHQAQGRIQIQLLLAHYLSEGIKQFPDILVAHFSILVFSLLARIVHRFVSQDIRQERDVDRKRKRERADNIRCEWRADVSDEYQETAEINVSRRRSSTSEADGYSRFMGELHRIQGELWEPASFAFRMSKSENFFLSTFLSSTFTLLYFATITTMLD